MSELLKMFKKECEEAGIDFIDFPFGFQDEYPIVYHQVIEGIMWILKRRQDKVLVTMMERLVLKQGGEISFKTTKGLISDVHVSS